MPPALIECMQESTDLNVLCVIALYLTEVRLLIAITLVYFCAHKVQP